MPNNVLSQVELTIDKINNQLESLRQEIPRLLTRNAANEWLKRCSLSISDAIRAGLNTCTSSDDKKKFRRQLSLRIHPDSLKCAANQRLQANLAPIVVEDERFTLLLMPQTILNTISEDEQSTSLGVSFNEWLFNLPARFYAQIINDMNRYPESFKVFIYCALHIVEILISISITLPIAMLSYSNPFHISLLLVAYAQPMFMGLRYGLQFLYADENERENLNIQFNTFLSTLQFTFIAEILYKEITAPFPENADYGSLCLLFLLRASQVLLAPLFFLASAGEWFLFQIRASLSILVATLSILLINLPLYAFDLFNYLSSAISKNDCNASPNTDTNQAPTPSQESNNACRFFASTSAQPMSEPNSQEEPYYSPSMTGID